MYIQKMFVHIEHHSHAITSGKPRVCKLEYGRRNTRW